MDQDKELEYENYKKLFESVKTNIQKSSTFTT